jgi:hypothetical protein
MRQEQGLKVSWHGGCWSVPLSTAGNASGGCGRDVTLMSQSSSSPAMVSVPAQVVTKTRCYLCEEGVLQRGLKGRSQSGGLAQGRYAACWLGCGRASVAVAKA